MADTIDIDGCARCGGDHKDVPVVPMKHPGEITHYCFCPVTGEPVWVRVGEVARLKYVGGAEPPISGFGE